MRKQILELLRKNMQQPVSGEDISNQFGVSRTAIWKHIQALKTEGYDIESVPKKGYILRGTPDKLSPEEIEAALQTKWLGRNIRYCETINSTNELAKKAANEGCADGLVAIAEEQVSGKGRLSRGWPWRLGFSGVKTSFLATGSTEMYTHGGYRRGKGCE